MEEKKMILVTDGYDDKPVCVASNTIAARKSALDYLENQYDDGEWEAILEEDGYKNAVTEIILTLELGGTKADLERMLKELD